MSDLASRHAVRGTRYSRRLLAVPLILLVALLAAVPVVTNDYIQYVVNLILVYVLVTVGFNLVLGYLGQLAFCNTAFYGVGAYTAGLVATHLTHSFVLVVLGSALAGTLAGLLVSLPALRLSGYYLAIVTLAFGEMLRWAYIHADTVTQGSTGLLVPTPELFGMAVDSQTRLYFAFIVTVAVMLWLVRNILGSRFGRALVAIRNNRLAAMSVGVAPAQATILAFALSGCVVGVAGGLFAMLTSRIAPENFGLGEMLIEYSMVMIGGLGSLWGSVLGAVLLTGAPEFLRNFAGYEEIIFSLLLIVVLRVSPRGLGGVLSARLPFCKERLFVSSGDR
ncbi:branched-chain amino acid transport system permease protein [Paraburkholderia sp. CI2]|uniref:branched-chain amino acid ABC transporter permease n=1 Tax=unclassified Paraburkholderia TaxID=2615204 RepID=UPI00161CED87|nr:branched-chain amino acid ABC transporter permease [Paraburkholderia sp. CI2]MBB5466780.1 branched-chain amino acid transport system permease protein [Paraburkholderia sp. CI2]